MKNSSNRCVWCKHFDRYFTKGTGVIKKTEYGWCDKNTDSVCAEGYCGKFERKTVDAALRCAINIRLSDMLTDISAIRQVIENEYEKYE